MTMQRSEHVLALGAMILGLAACGGSTSAGLNLPAGAVTSAPYAANAGDACKLVTNEEVAAFLGIDPTAVEKKGKAGDIPGTGSICAVNYSTPAGSLQIDVNPNATDFPQDGHDISGLGDRARYRGVPGEKNPSTIFVIKGRTLLTILPSGTHEFTLDSLIALARAAVSRL